MIIYQLKVLNLKIYFKSTISTHHTHQPTHEHTHIHTCICYPIYFSALLTFLGKCKINFCQFHEELSLISGFKCLHFQGFEVSTIP